MKTITKSLIGIAGGLTILASSLNIDTYGPWKFDNPVPINATKKEIEKIVESRPTMKDYDINLNLFGAKVPLFKVREVIDKYHNRRFSGFLDKEGNIHTLLNGTYHLNSAHDSNWYSKE